MTLLRFQMTVGMILALLATLATEGFAQRGIGVKGRGQATPYINGTYRALVIGNDKYNDPEGLWKPLKTAVNDARAVADVLKNQYGFGDVRLLLNATRRQMGRAINRITEDSRENDSVLIYYAGHGYLRESTKEGYWIPVDAEGRDDTTYFRNSTIKTKLAVLSDRAKHVMLVSDSCFSGALLREGNRGINIDQKNERYFRKVAAKKSVQILAAGGLEFVDDNYKGTGHSPFTYFFLQELKNNTSGLLDATELSSAVVRNVANNVQQSPEKGVLHGAGHEGGEFFFARASVGSIAPVTKAKKQPRPAARSRQPINAEVELWQAIKTSKSAEDYQDYLRAYPKGRFALTARIKIRRLHRAESRRKSRLAEKPALTVVRQLGRELDLPAGMVNIPAGDIRGTPVNSFNLDVFETTNREFLAFVKANPSFRKSNMDKSRNDGDYLRRWSGDLSYAWKYANLPVVFVSQIVARVYCKWKRKRLPSSLEWSLAAGVGKRKYPWGNREPDEKIANFDKGLWGDPMPGGSHPKGASPEGVMHLAGNVWEPTSTIVRGEVVARGGSYFDPADTISNDYSGVHSTDPLIYSSRFMGIRCAF